MKMLNISPSQQQQIRSAKPLLWLNPEYQNPAAAPDKPDTAEIYDAEARLLRFAPLLQQLFPELEASDGIIESPLLQADQLHQAISPFGVRTLIKADHTLPVAGSIKARGGIHEVLCFAEQLALEHDLIKDTNDDYRKLLFPDAKFLFNQYEIAVGSTGNLGLSIGIIGAALGFKATVHMSVDAKEWKKERLRKRGVQVVEHKADYGAAVAAGRAQADANPKSYFVDDENSPRLFMGYAVAALRLKRQLEEQNIPVDADHPLFVYLPAGVGGAPGGITFGLKALFGPHVHCFFAEPVQAPCMLLGMAGPAGSEPVDVYDFDLTINTEADGLAVGQASQWVCDAIRDELSGVYTCEDDTLYQHLLRLKQLEGLETEPSATIGCSGPSMLTSHEAQVWLNRHMSEKSLATSTHLVWTTGGSFVPESEYRTFLLKATEKFGSKIS
ncbi:D-serine ammonia-lyase [Oceanospirillum sediminis]|uniref:Probable D-serine dehydratase n=1 Tax=Oceanospirillum sediminis TaxID=2760088 RepID=A0A839IQA0_9GAMM|nr:D-serine ammonia-lyase [Oceanospirillum sediminis]MBB1487138.1 D-serine ammonia-lyase [Oceanospirillum sediminis]